MPNVPAFIDDILIVTVGSAEEHIKTVDETLERREDANMSIKSSKCQFLCSDYEWLGYHIDQNGTSPMEGKLRSIKILTVRKTLKSLKYFMRAINQLNKFIPYLAQLCAPLRPLLSKTNP